MSKHPGRDPSKENTRLLRKLIQDKAIVVDTAAGLVLKPNGKPFATQLNYFGYLRFKVMVTVKRKRVQRWFFVHKAVFMAAGGVPRKGMELDHQNWIPTDNRAENLKQVTRRANMDRKKPAPEIEMPF